MLATLPQPGRALRQQAPQSVQPSANRRHSQYSPPQSVELSACRRKRLLGLAVDISPAVPLRIAERQMQRIEEDGFSPDGYSYLGQLALALALLPRSASPSPSPSPSPGPSPGLVPGPSPGPS